MVVISAIVGATTALPHDLATGRHAQSSGFTAATAPESLDLLSRHLMLLRLRGEVIYSAELDAPWSLGFTPGPAHFHYVEEGYPILTLADGKTYQANPGDLLLLPRGLGHSLRCAPICSVRAIFPLDDGHLSESPVLRVAGDGGRTRLVSGTFGFEAMSASILLQNLPDLIAISRDEGANAEWLGTLAHFLLAEAHLPRPGTAIMISRLIDVLVVQTLRAWVSDQDGGDSWLGAIDDPAIERALAALHADPFREWSLSNLAGIAIMSRSVFADRFTAALGAPPLRYLKNWRLALAEDMLRTGTHKVSDVSRRVGYASDAAFSRAFKARFGYPPIETRRAAPARHLRAPAID